MKRAGEKYKDKGLTVVWVGFQDRQDRIKEFAELHGLSKAGYDEGDNVSKSFGIRYGAGAVIVNARGIVKARIPRGISAESLDENIRKIL